MSLQRMRLRTAFVRCLSNGGATPFPTIALDRVFDSMIGEMQEQEGDQMMPFIAVYTDTDQRSQMARGDPIPVFARLIDVVIEIAIGTWISQDDGSGNTERVFAAPQTDAECEALLDMLEFQIWRQIFDTSNPHAVALHRIVKELSGWDSISGRSPKGNHKVSARQLTITCRVADDCRPDFDQRDAPSSIASLFPPYLHGLVRDIGRHPALASLKALLTNLTTQPGAPQPAPGISFGVQVDFIDPVVDRSLLPPGETQGPDGRIEIEADWQPPPEQDP